MSRTQTNQQPQGGKGNCDSQICRAPGKMTAAGLVKPGPKAK